MNGYNFLEDTQTLKLKPFRDFYQSLAEAKLEDYQSPIKLNDFIQIVQVIEIKNIMIQQLADTLISEYPLIHYLFALINTPSAHQSNALQWAF